MEQYHTTKEYVLPYISTYHEILPSTRVLEIGCGEGGNLKTFIDLSCEVVGIDLNESQIERAKEFTKEFCTDISKTSFICKNIYDVNVLELGKFDVVLLRDVIEHIPNQSFFLKELLSLRSIYSLYNLLNQGFGVIKYCILSFMRKA